MPVPSTESADAPIDEMIALAHRLADAAGEIARRYFRTGLAIDDKADESPVTIADREAEQAMRRLIEAERPEDGIFGEEFGAVRTDARYVWVLDPIDGTKAFLTGRPLFGTLIAVLDEGRPVMGLIDQPVVRDRWVGAKGRPTTLNGAEIRTRACPELGRAIIGTTSPDMFPQQQFAAFRRVADAARITVYGGDCYAYGLIAAGTMDLIVETSLKLYDYAALVPVIEGAGGAITDWQGRPLGAESGGDVIAAGDQRMLDEARRLLAG